MWADCRLPSAACRLPQGSRETGHARPSGSGTSARSTNVPVSSQKRKHTHTHTHTHTHKRRESLRRFQASMLLPRVVCMISLAANNVHCSTPFPLHSHGCWPLIVSFHPFSPAHFTHALRVYILIDYHSNCHRITPESISICFSYRVRILRKIPTMARLASTILAYETSWTLKCKLPA